ncbi:hypothetical protein ACJIZ3_018891 [Penstemon smallii]|uniref:C3H1-type domain-containing protein n=1 Tax=Penstemon smallii TaxID=265156 RepID=A0ABD3SZN0_9LAMI
MPPKKELCVHFQSGRCRFGDRCRNLHPTQQQSKTNPFGFGGHSGTPFQNTNQQQQKPNPFGFGVQNNTQLRGVNDAGFKPGQVKPFENKWTRSTINTGSAPVSRQSDNKPAAADHKCTDPELCKRVIVEDLKDEKPEWKLTCYGHNRSYTFGQSSAFQNQSQPSSMFQTKNLPLNSSGAFGQSSAFQNQSQPSSMFQMKNLPFNSSEGPNSSTIGAQKNPFSTFTNSSQVGNLANNQLNFVSNLPSSASSAFGQSSMSTQLISNMPKESSNVDGTIWSKAEWKWNMGEIPEEAPPDIYIH